ncbi:MULTISPECIES: glycosyltransferase family 4 protein [Desulfococcus]|uniref:Glycosyl transferase group 1 n=1 Tax=Desulfococcus multivorans DSM 2059 TaxID=1121405 RepID=S7TPY9_DESML|nr:glycosyltransferase family 4 protein [Desulfococcus multivorans]AOY57943.1 glycosyltransferase, family I [Desulfococcus multivorans]AQV00314.1 glycosyl transferase family 1 [Desulfococcus multivorans]EPR39026.1 glycosyl transferase group 1 [Desulfococcus multivorans DSM 2059]SJZ64852.1 Glycosyltransferase involved in cell wall bisynthesis [Desulfococcus multivorans DSM 2059]
MPERHRRPLRVCLLSYRSNPHCGGQGVYIRHLSKALTNLGHQVDVISGPPLPILDKRVRIIYLPGLDLYNPENLFRTPSLRELRDPINLLEWTGVSTMGFPEPMTFGIRAFQFLRNRLDRYDIIHDNQSLSYGVWALKNRIPAIVTIHHPITVDRDVAVRSVRSWWKKLKHRRWYSFIGMQIRVARKFSRIITVSERTRADISREFSIPDHRFRVIPNGIDTDVFHPVPEIRRDPRRIIVTNSADMPLKGLYYLLQAIADIAGKTPDLKLIVVGTPKRNGGVVKLIRRLGIGDHIRFTGRITDAAFVIEYAKAGMAVVPSVYEGFGLPAGEAMACGVPVISTTGGALPEVVGDAGILVPPADPDALGLAIQRLMDNPDHAWELGMKGRKRVQENFTWQEAAVKTAIAYQEVIDDYR